MGTPFFSIIIPTYNRASQLEVVVQSVLQQTFPSYELIVIDDGSTDTTEEIILPFLSDRVIYFRTANFERSHARNLGAKHAKGMYLNFFDSDDQMYPDRLKNVFDFIESENQPNVLFTHYDLKDKQGTKVGATERHYKSFTRDLIFNNFLATGTVFMKRHIALNNPFVEDRKIITAEDWELWLRIHAQYDFYEFMETTFALIHHEERSLITITDKRIEERDLYFIELVQNQEAFKKKYKGLLNLFVADRYTFIALTLVINKKTIRSLWYLLKALKSSFRVVGRKRFWGVLKNIL